MAEYIEREALLELYTMDDPVWNEFGHVPLPVIRQNILDIPTADVAPVVRCEKCKHTFGHKKGFVLCKRGWMPNDGFCSYGERGR